MTKPDAINLLRVDSHGSVQQHEERIAELFKHASALQEFYNGNEAQGSHGKRFVNFCYFTTLARIDAHLTLIDR